jgi:methylisocitrate lyase
MLFPEALTTLEEYSRFVKEIPNVPILANITEFGKTPLFTRKELDSVGKMIN